MGSVSLVLQETATTGNPEVAGSNPGGVLPHIRYIDMCRPKTGIDFEHFGLKLDMVNGGLFTKAYKLIFLSSNRCE